MLSRHSFMKAEGAGLRGISKVAGKGSEERVGKANGVKVL